MGSALVPTDEVEGDDGQVGTGLPAWVGATWDRSQVLRYGENPHQRAALYTSGHDQKVRLIDMHGDLVREWGLPYSQVWDKSAAVSSPLPDSHVYIEKSHLYPNGDMLALYVAVGDTPWGYGLVKFDKDNKVSKLYDVNAMPSTVFIDRKGNVRYLHRGYKAGDEGEYLNQIRALLKE